MSVLSSCMPGGGDDGRSYDTWREGQGEGEGRMPLPLAMVMIGGKSVHTSRAPAHPHTHPSCSRSLVLVDPAGLSTACSPARPNRRRRSCRLGAWAQNLCVDYIYFV
jgi:hypothetical protein